MFFHKQSLYSQSYNSSFSVQIGLNIGEFFTYMVFHKSSVQDPMYPTTGPISENIWLDIGAFGR